MTIHELNAVCRWLMHAFEEHWRYFAQPALPKPKLRAVPALPETSDVQPGYLCFGITIKWTVHTNAIRPERFMDEGTVHVEHFQKVFLATAIDLATKRALERTFKTVIAFAKDVASSTTASTPDGPVSEIESSPATNRAALAGALRSGVTPV